MFEPLRKYATFTGRARRMEYWLFWLFAVILQFVVGLLTGGFGSDPMHPAVGLGLIVYCLIALALFVPSIAVGVRRLHDTERSGWWLLIAFIPIIGALVLLVFFLLEGTRGPNKYGPDPKDVAEPAPAAA
ncbi:MAG: DUF805 domain-containing protein [Phenylobacterium sp.]